MPQIRPLPDTVHSKHLFTYLLAKTCDVFCATERKKRELSVHWCQTVCVSLTKSSPPFGQLLEDVTAKVILSVCMTSDGITDIISMLQSSVTVNVMSCLVQLPDFILVCSIN